MSSRKLGLLMKLKIALGILGVSLLLAAITSPVNASGKTSTGPCLSGATWTLTQTRSGSKVTTAVTVKPVLPNSKWNINYAYPNQYVVANFGATADRKGVLSFKHTFSSSSPVYALVLVDTWGPASVTTCVLGGTA